MKSTKHFSTPGIWIGLCAVVIVAATAAYHELLTKPKKEAAHVAHAAKPDAEKYHGKVLCLKGVEYWYLNPGSHSAIMAPKYSPGKPNPDTCP